MKVLFVSHEANRTGAPLLLLGLLRWLDRTSDLEISVLLRRGGELAPYFRALAETYYYEVPPLPTSDSDGGGLRAIARRALEHIGLRRAWTAERWEAAVRANLLHTLNAHRFDLVYSNTAVNGEVLEWLGDLGVPVISHVHELENVLRDAGSENWARVRARTTHYVAASDAVRRNLVDNRSVEPGAIDVVHEFIDTGAHDCGREARSAARRELNIPDTAFVVCGSGMDAKRKGTDLFIELSAQVAAKVPHACFVWVGGWKSTEEEAAIRAAADRSGVSDRLHFTGEVEKAAPWFCAADVFALPSREDPFPLVCLESAAMGKPIVCFRDAGGMPEFVEEDSGFVVPFEDTREMAERVVQLSADPELALMLGERARRKVRERHDLADAATRILDLMNEVASQGRKWNG